MTRIEVVGGGNYQGPPGPQGERGESFKPDALGPASERPLYNTEAESFAFLDTENGLLYFKKSATSGDWSLGIPFGPGEKGETGEQGGQGIAGPPGPPGVADPAAAMFAEETQPVDLEGRVVGPLVLSRNNVLLGNVTLA